MYESNLRDYIELYFQIYDYFKNRLSEINPYQPLHIYVEPINICNLDCPFCATKMIGRKRQSLDMKIYLKTIDCLVRHGWNRFVRLTLTGHGEPLLNKNLAKMIRYAKDNGILSVELITNGTLVDAEHSHALLASGLDRIQFSIDSLNKDVYDSLRRPKIKNRSYFKVTMTNILRFLLLNEENDHSVYTSILAVSTERNRDEGNHFSEFWYSLPVDNVYLAPLSTLQNNNPMEEAIRFKGDIKGKPVCIIPWTTCTVKSNGDVTICSHDFQNSYPVGNISTDDLYQLWNNDKAKELRHALINGDVRKFVEIGHDCFSCNNPSLGCGREDFLNDLPVYMEKTVFGKLNKPRGWNTDRMEQLQKIMESYQ